MGDVGEIQISIDSASADGKDDAIAFTGIGRDYFRVLIRGALLGVVSLGMYRFWLITELRRHLWSHTGVGGDRLEYTGRGIELFFGFLFALAILAPVYVLYFAISIEAARYKALAGGPLLAVFFLFGQFAIYRARRYRLTRTIWRGIRFWMSGSGTRYMLLSTGWMFLVILTLGLLLPWREAALERYKMSNTFYGDLRGSFEGKPVDFFKRGVWLWLLPWFMFALVIGISVVTSAATGTAMGGMSPFHLLTFLMVVSAPFLYGAYRRIEMLWWIDGLRLGQVRFKADPERIRFTGLYWKTIGSSLLAAFVVLIPLLVLIAVLKRMASEGSHTPPVNLMHSGFGVGFVAFTALTYIALLMIFGMIQHWFLQRGFWKTVANATSVENLEAAAHVKAMGQPSNAMGEGLASMLDVSGF